jgi:hypothetical protein
MMDETQADAGTPRPLTLEWMQASRDRWQQKAIDRKERLGVILAAARTVVEAWDRWMATSSPDRPSIRDLDAAIDALRPSSASWYDHS